MSTQTDKAGGGRSLWHCPLEWLPVSLLFLLHRQGLRLAQETQSPSANLYPCHTCSTQGISAPLLQQPGPETSSSAPAAHRHRGKGSLEKTLCKKWLYPEVETTTPGQNLVSPFMPAPQDCVGQCAGPPGAQGLCLAGC